MPQKWTNTIPFGSGHTLGTFKHGLEPLYCCFITYFVSSLDPPSKPWRPPGPPRTSLTPHTLFLAVLNHSGSLWLIFEPLGVSNWGVRLQCILGDFSPKVPQFFSSTVDLYSTLPGPIQYDFGCQLPCLILSLCRGRVESIKKTCNMQIFSNKAWFCKTMCSSKLFTSTCKYYFTDISVVSVTFHNSDKRPPIFW